MPENVRVKPEKIRYQIYNNELSDEVLKAVVGYYGAGELLE